MQQRSSHRCATPRNERGRWITCRCGQGKPPGSQSLCLRTNSPANWLRMHSDSWTSDSADDPFSRRRDSRYSKEMRIAAALAIAGALVFSGCGTSGVTDEIGLTQVTFPDGTKINAETMHSSVELMRG